MKIYCGICFRIGSCAAIYPRSLQPTTVNTTTSARKDNQVAIPTVTIPTPFFFQSVRGDVSFVSENNARIVFDTLPSPPFLASAPAGPHPPPTSRTQNDTIIHLSRSLSVHPLASDVSFAAPHAKHFLVETPSPLEEVRAWFSLNQSSISPPLSGRACRITRQDVRTISVASRHTHWK